MDLAHTESYSPWRMLWWLLMAQIMVAFIGRSLGPLSVFIEEDLSLTKAQVGLLPSALFLGQAVASIPMGLLSDRFGSRPLLAFMSSILGISFLMMTFQTTYWVVLLLIMVGGIGYGGMHPTTNRGIVYWFSQKKRGTAMGIKQMGITFGSALSAILLIPLAETYGWRTVVLISCFVLIAAGVIAYVLYRDPKNETPVQQQKPSLSSTFSSLTLMAKNKPLLFISLSAMGINGSQMCLNTYLVLFTYEQIGIHLVLAGLLLVFSEAGGSLGRIVWGVISDRIFGGERLKVMVIIVIITLVISAVVAFLPKGTPYGLLVPLFFVFGFAVSGFNGIWMNLASELVPKEQAGLSSGFSITLGSLGVILFPPLFGLIVDQSQGYTLGWLMISVLMIMVMVLLHRLNKMERTAY
ncbi:Regulatory protein UhpC [Halobacillus karajensis]|uniref:Regulatory protein UhpC n=3 Tax=Halobacillus karajensis TaxID=195088 RepID=A0A059NY89_9BACI|nr:Regulatory protein UhpC [Halobacillus karajensis]CDQ22962.1 Regulatory protein UhpC [Halobacillus karajensis]CDQ26445.1 Regulatory protein UhpC [Halobacillus karajensis]